MEKRSIDSTGRRKLAAFVLLLLPGFMFLGLLAPAAVSVKLDAQPEVVDTVAYREFASPRPPRMLVPRAVASASLSDALMPEALFTGARYLTSEARDAIALPDVAAADDQQIVLDDGDVEEYVADTLFDESAERSVLAVDLTPLWDPGLFDVIPPLLDRSGYSMYDDLHGTGGLFGPPIAPVVIPEPRTAALLSLGLVALALAARRVRA